MNQLVTAVENTTMTSREIAELTGKQHAHVLRDIRNMIDRLSADPDMDFRCESTTYTDTGGVPKTMYQLDKATTMCLVAGYDPIPRMRIIKRLEEYETNSVVQVQNTTVAKQLLIAEVAARMLRMSDTSKLLMLSKITENENLPKFLPNYAKQELVKSLTDRLKEHGSNISVRAANLVLVSLGILEEKTRVGTSGITKKFKSITEKGLKYGHNEVHPNNVRESQPLYYESTFPELLALIEEHLAEED